MNPTLIARFLRREGTRFALAGGSIAIGAAALAIVIGLVGSVEQFIREEGRVLIGGDLSISSAAPYDQASDPALTEALTRGSRITLRTETLATVRSERAGEAITALASAKIVDPSYPLFGALTLENPGERLPSPSGVFLAPALAQRLGVTIGESIAIGNTSFTVENLVLREPDEVGSGFRFGPLLLVGSDGWQRTGIAKEASRVTNTLLVAFPPLMSMTDRTRLQGDIEARAIAQGARVDVADRGPERLLFATLAAERFFYVIIALALFLAAVNVRVNLTYLFASLVRPIAILRALGFRRRNVLLLFALILALVAAGSGTLGAVLGETIVRALLPTASVALDHELRAVGFLSTAPGVILFSVFLALLSGTAFLSRITRVEPKVLLAGYHTEGETRMGYRRDLPYLLLALFGLFVGVWVLTGHASVGAIATAGIAGSFGMVALVASLVVRSLGRKRDRVAFRWRAIISFIRFQGPIFTSAIASLAIAIGAVGAIVLIQANIQGNLRGQFRADAPNLYLLDIQPDQEDGVATIMGETWRSFPIIRGRFMERDGIKIQENIDEEDPELTREFNLTYRSDLIEGERLVSGVWHGTTGRGEVSLEQDFAERAKLMLGSRVVFLVQGFPVSATVTSIRSAETTTGLPFFFLVFSPDVLEGLPRSSFGYAFLSRDEVSRTVARLTKDYPNVSALPIDDVLATLGRIVGLLGVAVATTAIPAIGLGLLLIVAMLALAARERKNDLLVFTALGAGRTLLRSLFVRESLAGLIGATIVGLGIAHALAWGLNRWVFDFPEFFFSPLVLGVAAFVLLTSWGIASLSARSLTGQSPSALLRKQ
jgi:putative ABC transport system permease protein